MWWWLQLFKPSNTVEDTFEADMQEALVVSQLEAETQEAIQLSLAIEESSRRSEQEKEEEKKHARKLDQVNKDEQIAKDLKRKELEEQVKKDEKVAKELKRKQFEEQVKKDAQIAKDLRRKELEEQVMKDEKIAKDLLEKSKRKQFEEEQVKDDEQIAKELQNEFSKMAYTESSGLLDNNSVSSDLFANKGKGKLSQEEMEEDKKKLTEVIPPRGICGGCDSEIEYGNYVDISGVLWHSECLWCDACDKPIAIHEVKNTVSNARGKYHKSCYQRFCYICKEKKMRMYHEHPFWKERYCSKHESEAIHKCCSCERLEPKETNYVMLGDTRWLCLECMESATMDTHEGQHLHFEIREYFEGLNMKIEKEFPFLLVEKQALNKAEKKEKIDNPYEVVTRGICLSEAQTVTSVSKVTRTGLRNEVIEKVTESTPVIRDCEVTAILILYGLPRLLTGYILAHEMMHAYLRLNGHRKLNNVHEEGICQVLGHMWLESQTYAEASSSSSSSRALGSSKKGKWTSFEKKLVKFCKNQIETDESRVYGVGFRRVNEMVMKSNLKDTLKEIIRLG